MALWIKNGWEILSTGLKQSMWCPTRGLTKGRQLAPSVYGSRKAGLRKQCVWSHRSHAFKSVFSDEELDFGTLSSMSIVDRIDCSKPEFGATEARAFAPSMFSESSTARNIAVFDDLNVIQMGIEKSDPRWNDWHTIWWGDLKTEIQMRSMQNVGSKARRPYERYQYIFLGLALWHLRFNYLKMVWEIFYPERSANERSTLQWATDHWRRDKITKPTDFHSLEDLTIHSYRARIIAIMRLWIDERAEARYDSKDSAFLGAWLSGITAAQWKEALEWLDIRMDPDQDPGLVDDSTVNDHWTNHV
ncbi:hypothetical protein MMC07_000224 [Pseudocyphellaria aurata]|nr:hypothetical protein [Pseudocyphellaria aurata]